MEDRRISRSCAGGIPGKRWEGLFAVVIWISGTQVTGTFQGSRVLRDRGTCRSLRQRLRLTSCLLCDFVSGVGIGTANGVAICN